MIDLRKIGIIFVVGILFAVFTFSVANAIMERPDSQCWREPEPAFDYEACGERNWDNNLEDQCKDDGGRITWNADERGCYVIPECDMCWPEHNEELERYEFIMFIISSLIGVIGVVIGLFLSPEKNELNGWVGTGLILGGIISVLGGTMAYWGGLHRIARPFVILVELLLVILVFYWQMGKIKR